MRSALVLFVLAAAIALAAPVALAQGKDNGNQKDQGKGNGPPGPPPGQDKKDPSPAPKDEAATPTAAPTPAPGKPSQTNASSPPASAKDENKTATKDATKENATAEREAAKTNRTVEREEAKANRTAEKEAAKQERADAKANRTLAHNDRAAKSENATTDAVPRDAPIAELESASLEPNREVVVDDVAPGAPARGQVRVHATETSPAARAVLVLVARDGSETELGEAHGSSWNTSDVPNGDYAIQLREQRPDGSNVTIASTRVIVENPRASPSIAVAALATGAAVSAATSAAASSGFSAFDVLRQSAQNLASDVAENRARLATAHVAAVRRARLRSAALLLGAAALLTFFKLYAERTSWSALWAAAPVAGAAILAAVLLSATAEWSIARAAGGRVRYKLWTPGAVSLGISSVLLGSPFGYPGYVDELAESHSPTRRALAGRAAGVLAATLGLVAPFLLVGIAWRWDFAEYGVGILLMAAAAGALPFAPYPGHSLWAWNRVASLATFALLAAVEILWQLALIPSSVLLGFAAFGLLGYVGALRFSARAPVAPT